MSTGSTYRVVSIKSLENEGLIASARQMLADKGMEFNERLLVRLRKTKDDYYIDGLMVNALPVNI